MRHPSLIAATLLASTLVLAACVTPGARGPRAEASIEARSGSSVHGVVHLVERGDRVQARIELSGLEPNSDHGFHVHEKGDCSAPDASSTGGHFNPANVAHGRAGSGVHHAGDLPSLHADANGRVAAEIDLYGVTLSPGPMSIAGRSLVVHRDADDFTSQPAGKSGLKVGCGVIALR